MEEIAVGVIGCGRSAVFSHIPALVKLGGCFRVAAVCDIEKPRRDLVESMCPGVRHYRRAEDMLDDADLELVYIATPSTEHDKIALEALRRRLWTVCETPVSLTHDGASILRGASVKAGKRLIAAATEMFSPEFRLASIARDRRRMGDVYDVRIHYGAYRRRDDWQSLKRCGGGALFYGAHGPLLQALSLLKTPPVQLWSELKKLVSVGDAEDYVRIMLKNSSGMTAEVEVNSASVPPMEPAIVLRGTRGSFVAEKGCYEGVYRIVDSSVRFPRKRSGVATPPLECAEETIRVKEECLELPDRMNEYECFWSEVYSAVRDGKTFPFDFETVVDATRYLNLARKNSPFAG